MLDKPNPNPAEPKREIPPMPSSVSGDMIIIQGNVGAGANVGSGNVTADTIAQGDITYHNTDSKANTPEQFIVMLGDLRSLLEKAKNDGELDPKMAEQAIKNLDTAVQMVTDKEKKPAKPDLIKRLEAVAQMIDAGVDMLTQEGSVGAILLKALPVAVMLVKLATQLF